MQNTSYDIRVATNGFIVERSWFEEKDSIDRYKSEKSVFKTWQEVIDFLQNNELNLDIASQ